MMGPETARIYGRIRPVALITGASSGIGQAFAHYLAHEGYDLVITGRRHQRLETLAGELTTKYNAATEIITAELSDPLQIRKIETRIDELDLLEVLVNNAGYIERGAFEALGADAHEAMIGVHAMAPVRFCRAALPRMIQRRKGSIINVASVAGFAPGVSNAIYSATKSFLITFTEALHVRLQGTGVRVQALCPGLTRTEFHERGGVDPRSYPRFMWKSPEIVVARSLRALKHGPVVYVPDAGNRLVALLCRIAPRGLYYSVASIAARKRRKIEKRGSRD
jgi:hypothetical protein